MYASFYVKHNILRNSYALSRVNIFSLWEIVIKRECLIRIDRDEIYLFLLESEYRIH